MGDHFHQLLTEDSLRARTASHPPAFSYLMYEMGQKQNCVRRSVRN
jgi:hypothetical protein